MCGTAALQGTVPYALSEPSLWSRTSITSTSSRLLAFDPAQSYRAALKRCRRRGIDRPPYGHGDSLRLRDIDAAVSDCLARGSNMQAVTHLGSEAWGRSLLVFAEENVS